MNVYGWHAVLSRLGRHPGSVRRILLQSGRRDPRVRELETLSNAAGIAIKRVSKQTLDVAVRGVHQGIVAQCSEECIEYTEDDLGALLDESGDAALVLVLDGITDPRNLGACIRTAEAAGASAVVFPKKRSATITDVARKAASGAAESVPWVAVTNLARTLRELREHGVWIIGAHASADRLWHEVDYRRPVAFVLGSEGRGMRRLTREHCDELVRIPMAGSVDSLNVSVATGVCLFEVCRQRLRK